MSQSELFDRTAIARKLGRLPVPVDDFVTDLIWTDLIERLDAVTRTFEKALLITPLSHQGRDRIETVSQSIAPTRFATLDGRDRTGEFDELPGDFDLVISLYDLAITNDVPAFLRTLGNRLRPDGLLVAAFLGGYTLTELRDAWIEADAERFGGAALRIAPMIEMADASALLQAARLGLPIIDLEPHTIRYAHPLALMRDIKALGGSNPMRNAAPGLVTPGHLARAIAAYETRFGDPDGRVRATLEIVWLSAWKPHESQQKPLRPGSAEVSLTRILKDRS
ncbi:MAG: SAM-dependent methyltransferase [Hyphomicrobiaceae bacterium]|nr:SAM-dependent methyltransferase [Hyphomicrobiaceae bacterium]